MSRKGPKVGEGMLDFVEDFLVGVYFFIFFSFIWPSYTNIRTPCQASNEGDLPPREGAQTRLL